jgi:3-methyladenine DNA glycosylase Tag
LSALTQVLADFVGPVIVYAWMQAVGIVNEIVPHGVV